ncbi:aromatic ring-hydroxylating oxygenase subunit alpha [Achromobacter piechaudii]|uniref:Carnitine monooxygenase oxygenase subunit n=1 Tax=Achromobacter piechaudii ATCC 43553 TaxID=742159 RepID=D4XEG7_9BURK|nr:ring-hydroxylating oxygenase subunit alpha [Achromobacter piechaudii]EFF74816.1 rieske [2Fe-2S] domain protein [Achromobacter piechaudii ATCC 43553]
MNDLKLPADFCADDENAWTLPAAYYTRQSVFDFEKEQVFARQWLCVAHRSELAEPNDYVTREIIGESIVVLRDREGVLRAFYNVCPHRGHQLLQGSGRAKNVITCPYHAWTFKLDGELAYARNCDNVPNFDKNSATLAPIQAVEYGGFVFINMDPDAAPIQDQLPGLEARLRAACPVIDQLHLGARFVTQTPANWKLIVDNYLECYHCGPVHPSFADSVQVEHYTHTMHGNWTLQMGLARSSEKSFKVDASVKDPSFAGFWAWPCTMFNVPPGADFMTVIYEFPASADVTLQHYDIYFLNKELTEDQQKLVEWYRDVFRPEDLRLVESVQKGMRSRGYRGQGRIMVDRQRSGISEHGIVHFHRKVAQAYEGERHASTSAMPTRSAVLA